MMTGAGAIEIGPPKTGRQAIFCRYLSLQVKASKR